MITHPNAHIELSVSTFENLNVSFSLATVSHADQLSLVSQDPSEDPSGSVTSTNYL